MSSDAKKILHPGRKTYLSPRANPADFEERISATAEIYAMSGTSSASLPHRETSVTRQPIRS